MLSDLTEGDMTQWENNDSRDNFRSLTRQGRRHGVSRGIAGAVGVEGKGRRNREWARYEKGG